MKKTKLMAVMVAVSLAAVLVMAQSVPQLINYQGRLLNSAGQPLDGVTVNLTFTFYSQQSGGTVFLTVQQSNVSVSHGVYIVLIGSGIVTPGTDSTLADLFKNHTSVWLGVKADGDPEMTPRSQIASVAYTLISNAVATGSIVSSSIGENCAVGEALVKTVSGWGCGGTWLANHWVWISGSNVKNQKGTYGIKGTPSPANVTGSRESPVSWIDASGNLWLFGGFGYSASNFGHLNDLWKWDGSNWTWISGSNSVNQDGTYGTKGTPAPANVPGSRGGAVSWIDISGNLWLFGGFGYAAGSSEYLNDLWKWDGSNWTWISGSNSGHQFGTYGTKGTQAPSNVPGGRSGAVSWIEASGHFWLFGGFGYAASSGGDLNDLWQWNGSNWTWISGSNGTDQYGTYGTKGEKNPANVPGGRSGAVSWIDASGNLWLFGGYGYAASGLEGYLNDLWKLEGNDWIWISGSNTINQNGTYGTLGTPAPANVPGSRTMAVSWIDASGHFWLFGGQGNAASESIGYLNDLWKWDGSNWTWISGSNAIEQNGSYGIKGTPALDNVLGSRYGAVSWIDSSSRLWLFGGYGYAADSSVGWLNDLWKYYP